MAVCSARARRDGEPSLASGGRACRRMPPGAGGRMSRRETSRTREDRTRREPP